MFLATANIRAILCVSDRVPVRRLRDNQEPADLHERCMLTIDPSKDIWKRFTADMMRYTGPNVRPWSAQFVKRLINQANQHPGLIAIAVYRYGQWVRFRCRIPVVRQICECYYFYWYNWVRTHLQIELPRNTIIDGGLRISHFGNIIVHSKCVAGKSLSLGVGVLIGQTPTGVPTLGDDVDLSAGVKVIGGIRLGNGVTVGAGAVVTKSFDDNSIVAGVPARLLRVKESVSARVAADDD
jgi:serine O-acetyltransferase